MEDKEKTLEQVQLDHIEKVLMNNNNHRSASAKILDMSLRTLYNWVTKLQKRSPKYREFEKKVTKIRMKQRQIGTTKLYTYSVKPDNYYNLTDEEYQLPTNEERIEYMDKLINADYPFKE